MVRELVCSAKQRQSPGGAHTDADAGGRLHGRQTARAADGTGGRQSQWLDGTWTACGRSCWSGGCRSGLLLLCDALTHPIHALLDALALGRGAVLDLPGPVPDVVQVQRLGDLRGRGRVEEVALVGEDEDGHAGADFLSSETRHIQPQANSTSSCR